MYKRQSHEWVEFLEDGSARIGMTDYAQDQMGDLVFVNLPEPEDEVTAGEALSLIHISMTTLTSPSPIFPAVDSRERLIRLSPIWRPRESESLQPDRGADVYKRQLEYRRSRDISGEAFRVPLFRIPAVIS